MIMLFRSYTSKHLHSYAMLGRLIIEFTRVQRGAKNLRVFWRTNCEKVSYTFSVSALNDDDLTQQATNHATGAGAVLYLPHVAVVLALIGEAVNNTIMLLKV